MDYQEYRRRRLNTEEREAILRLDMLGRSFGVAVDKLEGRLKGVKNVKRDLGMMKYILRHLLEGATEDVPADQLEQTLRQSRDYRLNIERVSVQRPHEECVMPIEDEWQFVSLALEARCQMCLPSARDAKECRLRAMLRRYVDEPDPGCLTGCGYCRVRLDPDHGGRMNKQKTV